MLILSSNFMHYVSLVLNVILAIKGVRFKETQEIITLPDKSGTQIAFVLVVLFK